MSARDKHARKRPRRGSSAGKPVSPARRRPHRRAWEVIADLLGGTKKAVLAIGAIAGAVVAIVTVVGMILPRGPTPKPAVEASFPEAKVEPDIVLAQYEYNNQPASSTNASDLGEPQIRYTLAADASTSASTTAQADNGTVSTGTETIRETPEEAEAKLLKEKEEKAAREKALEEEARKREALKAKEAAKKAREAAEAKEEARLRVKEEATLRHEQEQEEKELFPVKKSGRAQGARANDNRSSSSGSKPMAEPVPSPRSFHKQGAAKVAIGTGAPTKEIDAVLRRAKEILARRAARLGQGYGRSDAAFESTSATETAATSELASRPPDHALLTAASDTVATTLANSVPSHCGTSCALAPTVDKALADYSSNLAQAARVVAAAFSESRVELYEAKPQPVGVTVDYTIHFVGYEGQLMKLEWTLDASGRPLPKTWWRKVVVKQIVPTGESIGVSGNFWAPEPLRRGNYYFSLRVLDGSAEPTHKATELFH